MTGDHTFESDEEFVGEAEEALVDGGRAIEVNVVRAALANRDFRILWSSNLGSAMGTWMQNVILAAFVFNATQDAFLVALVGFCNLVPQLFFATIGGVIADMFDRRTLIFWLSFEQLLGSLAIAWIVSTTDFSRPALLIAVFLVGTGAALQGPVFIATTPSLVPPEHLAGAISLNSVSMNVSRVIGPAIGAMLYVWIGASWVFVLNAATYVIIMVGVRYVRFPVITKRVGESVSDRLFGGFKYVRRDPVVFRAILTVLTFSLFSMPFVVLYPAIAEIDWGVASKSTIYGFLYATFGLGAVVGSLAIGTFLTRWTVETMVRWCFAAFGICLAMYITVRQAWMAFPIGFVLGFFYFAAITSLTTVFQSRLDHAIRGRVSAVWMMCFGGTVPVSGLIAGWIVGFTGVNPVIYFGAAFAMFLAWFADLRPPEVRSRPVEALTH